MDKLTTETMNLYAFTVKDGRGRPADIDPAGPQTADEDPTRASSTVEAGKLDADGNIVPGGKGEFVLTVTGITESAKDGDGNQIALQTTVTIDADVTPEGTDNKVGAVSYTIDLDPRTANKVLEFSAPVSKDKPIA